MLKQWQRLLTGQNTSCKVWCKCWPSWSLPEDIQVNWLFFSQWRGGMFLLDCPNQPQNNWQYNKVWCKEKLSQKHQVWNTLRLMGSLKPKLMQGHFGHKYLARCYVSHWLKHPESLSLPWKWNTGNCFTSWVFSWICLWQEFNQGRKRP